MKIDISTIVKSINKVTTEEVEFSFDTFESKDGTFTILEKSPISLKIANQENAVILITGEVDLTVAIPCGRCLEDVPTNIHFDIEKKLTISGDTLVDEDMEQTDYLIGFEMDVDNLVYTEILVNWPMKVLCKDDCEGICRVCGMNLNKGTCSCQRTELDPRMAAIQDIFNKFKEV
ncbi:MAG: DUF177 domain-containing protein [Agathobacter sp.]|nr:DUF177 domain-containing protein [Agathobacter sp.]